MHYRNAMRLAAFAFDYDGTLATDGCVDAATLGALARLKAAGLRLLLVTGRELPELQSVFSHYALFDAIVAENGGLLFQPGMHEERILAAAPPATLLQALQRRRVPLSVGRSILATWKPHESEVLAAIRECGLEWQIIFNKHSVMCLPPGVNKASGLTAALETLQLSPLNVLAVGDAENDHAMLQLCGYRAAVANAIETLRREADIVTRADHGAGVVELIERFLADPPRGITAGVRRHDLVIGRDEQGRTAVLPPDEAVLIAGSAGADRPRLMRLLIERGIEHGFQLCIIDPAGDFGSVAGVTVLGDAHSAPGVSQVQGLLQEPRNQLALNLRGVDSDARPRLLALITAMLESLYRQRARPHWLLIDEAEQMLPAASQTAPQAVPGKLPGTVLVSSHPEALAPRALERVRILIALGAEAAQTVSAFCRVLQLPLPSLPAQAPAQGQAWYWARGAEGDAQALRLVQLDEPSQPHQGERAGRRYTALA